jgi:osmotically-inducible protein OsmY
VRPLTRITEGRVPDEVYELARPQLSETQLVNLTLAIVAINGANRLNIAFRTVPGNQDGIVSIWVLPTNRGRRRGLGLSLLAPIYRLKTVKKQEPNMSDLQLRQDILDELKFEPSVNAAHIGVAVESGVVTLTGHASTYPEKLAVVKAVRRVKGVRAIAEEIEVRLLGDKKTADDEIAKRAVDILGWYTMVPSGSIQITVRDGWVTLSGNVDWYFQKTTAEEGIRKLSEVRGVINNIAIAPRVQGQDVKRKIEDTLKRHAEIEAKAIRVTVQDGNKIVLESNVQNWDERYAVETAAWSAPGVKSVEDRLAIA